MKNDKKRCFSMNFSFSIIIEIEEKWATERDRTADLRITNALLYQLSYSGY